MPSNPVRKPYGVLKLLTADRSALDAIETPPTEVKPRHNHTLTTYEGKYFFAEVVGRLILSHD